MKIKLHSLTTSGPEETTYTLSLDVDGVPTSVAYTESELKSEMPTDDLRIAVMAIARYLAAKSGGTLDDGIKALIDGQEITL